MNFLKFDFIIDAALGFFSIDVMFENPRDNASSPIIPEPAYISRKDLPSNSTIACRVLKTLILTFESVGRVIFSGGAVIFRPLNLPAVIII